ncbi:MAG: histidine phosphatase family protein [Bacteroidales bacterium]|nr:histidine phosphatase family protein [Bacteroidales bacterium]
MSISKILHIARHAKSSWDYEGVSDFDRPLKHRGINDAYEMARRMKIRNTLPELIMTSPANRALHTAMIFARVIELSYTELLINPDIYGSDAEGLYHIIKHLDDKYYSVMIFGHNPEFTGLANFLAGELINEVPTCGVVSIFFDTDKWQDISKDKVTNIDFDFPKKEMNI